MSFFLKQNEDIVTGLKRIILEQINNSQSLLNNSKITGTSIHSVRKNIKRIRSILRLIRFELNGAYKEENAFYRDIGRKLSVIRDSKVFIDTINKLKNQKGRFPEIVLLKVRSFFYKEKRRISKIFFESGSIIESKELLEAGKNRIAGLVLEDKGFKTIYDGIKKIYGEGKKLLDKCKADPNSKNLHEWRKNVKYLWYQIRILRRAWPAPLKGFEGELHLLSDLLGDDHDLTLLSSEINSKENLNILDKEKRAITKTIINKQMRIRKSAYLIGMKIYTESPKSFADRLNSYYNI
jgi:CHAD domain-containing protein